MTAIQVIEDCLDRLGVVESEQNEYVEQSLLALRGWAGMIWQMEIAAPWTPFPMQRERFTSSSRLSPIR